MKTHLEGVRTGLIALILLLVYAVPSMAQGRIEGVVRDSANNDRLPGVNIVVVGTTSGAATDGQGRYSIDNLRAGEYSLRVSYIGFETTMFTGIRVRSGETTELNISLREAVLSTDQEVVVIGERPLVDVELASSSFRVTAEQIAAAPLRNVQDVAATQAGVIQDPTGLYIRGGRAYETGFVVDGVSATDPLAGTGFGIDIGSNAFAEVEVTTGGVGAEYGDVTSGVVSVQTQDGGEVLAGFFSHKRDNFGGFNESWSENYKEDIYEFNLGGPLFTRRLRFFTSGQAQLSDGFTRLTSSPDSVRSSIVGADWLLPRTGNRWNGLGKLTYDIRPGMRIQGSYQRSLTVNQNTRMLQVTGNEAVIAPGFQYAFILQPENANTFAHDTNISYVKWTHVPNDRMFYDVQLSRLFTRLRADANGRPWRPQNVDSELDPSSIGPYPGRIFTDENGNVIDPNANWILPGPGLINNAGLATRWHDHYAEEVTLRATLTRFTRDRNNRITAGIETKVNDYQWIDVIRPWVGAPIGVGDDAIATDRLGEAADVWRVQPRRGAAFATAQLRYRGLIANLGGRFEYWAPGKYVDEMVENPQAPILESIREAYLDESVSILGLRYKLRFLPRLAVSFPIRDNQVLFFNYGHTTRVPHPTFVYTGLDPFYQDRSFFSDLGNPNLNPEVDISYEIGLRNQLTSNDVLNVTAFWRDKFDFITVENVVIADASGRETQRAFRVNGDFARVRGIEAMYLKRVGRWFRGQVSGSFSRATGLSSTNNDALAQFLARGDIDNTFETPLAWDRPLDLKASTTFIHRRDTPFLGVPGLNNFQVYIASTFRSGQRYTPVEYIGRQENPFTGDRDWRPIYQQVSDPAQRFGKVGAPWWWFDLNVRRDVKVAGNSLQFTLEVTNLFNQLNSVIVNPVTGKAYPNIDPSSTNFASLRDNGTYDVPMGTRDPRYEDPSTSGLPPFNPARFLPQRHVLLGLSYRF
jgi:outer membrane receptor protein involved in Fe transport